jgi:hypothetical protein
MADTKISALTAMTDADVAVGDLMTVVDVSDTTMAASGTNKKITMANLRAYMKPEYNASVASQAGFSSDTYLVGSSITIPTGRLQAKTMYRATFNVVKTNAGTATPILNIRFGTAGTTADTSRGQHTFTAGTAAADEGVWDVWATFRTVGSGTTAVLQSLSRITHKLSVTGITGTAATSEAEIATSAGFDSTVASSIIGLSVNGGTSASWTISLVQAELFNLV